MNPLLDVAAAVVLSLLFVVVGVALMVSRAW